MITKENRIVHKNIMLRLTFTKAQETGVAANDRLHE